MKSEYTELSHFQYDGFAKGDLYFYVGAGISRSSGLPGWAHLTETVLDFREKYEGKSALKGLDPANADDSAKILGDFLKEGPGLPIMSRSSNSSDTFGRSVLLNLLFRYDYEQERFLDSGDLKLQNAIWRCFPHGVMTTNYDTLIERAYPHWKENELRVYRYYAEFLRFVRSNPAFVLKLHGDINDLGTMILDPTSAWRSGGRLASVCGDDLVTLYDTLCRTGHMVYLGAGFRDETIRRLDQWRQTPRGSHHRHVALLPIWELENSSKELARSRAEGRFKGIEFVGYNDSKSPEEQVSVFLSDLASQRQRDQVASRWVDEGVAIHSALQQRAKGTGDFGARKNTTRPWTLTKS